MFRRTLACGLPSLRPSFPAAFRRIDWSSTNLPGRHTDHSCPVRHIFGDNRACAGARPGPNRDWGDEHCVASDESTRADIGAVLVDTIEIAGHSASADIHV